MNRDTLYHYFEGIASDEELRSIKAWTEASEENVAELVRERKFFDAMLVSPAPDVYRTNDADEGRKRVIPRWIKEVARTVAAAAVVVGVMAGLHEAGVFDRHHTVAMQTIEAPAGQRVNLTLPDGTQVWLNSCTKLSYPTDFAKKVREVEIDGEAYFDVTRMEKVPFIVRTYCQDVQVLGTKFDVAAFEDRGIFEASLLKGSIRLISKTGSMTRLFPGQKAEYIDGRLCLKAIEDYDVYRWKNGLYCFREKKLKDVFSDLERYYDVRFAFDNKVPNDSRITGKFRITDGLDYALGVLRYEVGFRYEREKDSNVIHIMK